MKPSSIAGVVAAVAVGFLAWWVLQGRQGALPPQAPEGPPVPQGSGREVVPHASPPRVPSPESDTPAGDASTGLPAGAEAAPPAPPPPREDLPAGPPAPGEVAGRVLRFPDRSPVRGAVVRLVGGGPGRDVAPFPDRTNCTTGTNGVFRIGGFHPGDYLFEAALEGHGPRSFRVAVPAGGGAGEVEVLFGDGGAVEGMVTDSKGAGLPGVPVRIERSGSSGGGGRAAGATGTDGGYRFEDLVPGSYSLGAGRQGRNERLKPVSVIAGETARCNFPGGASLAGVLAESDGTPLPGAFVRLTRSGGGYESGQAETGEDGRYRVEGLEPGPWRLGIQVLGERGFSADLDSVDLAPGENARDVRVGTGEYSGEIAGRVFARATGEPQPSRLSQITVFVMLRGDDGIWTVGRWSGMAFSDDLGRFRFRALAAGRHRILVHSLAGLKGAEVDVDLVAGERREGIDIALEERPPRVEPPASGCSLSGSVKDAEGRVLAGGIVYARPADGGGKTRNGRTDDAGSYRVEGLTPGEWTVQVQGFTPEAFTAEVATVSVRLGENALEIRLGKDDLAGEIRGRVFARSSERPLSPQEVQLVLFAIRDDGPPRFAGSASVDTRGGFRFRYVREGRWRILAASMAGELRNREVDVSLARGQRLEDVEVALDDLRTGRVRVTVLDPQGKPVLMVAIESLRDGKPQQGSVHGSSAEGIYETFFEVGLHRLSVRDFEGTMTGEASVEVREGETAKVEVVLRKK